MGKYAQWFEPFTPAIERKVRELSDLRLAEVKPAQLDWLEDNVDLTAPELDALSPERLLERFGQTPRRRAAQESDWDINDARLVRTLVWQYHLRVRWGLARTVRGTLRSFWLTRVRPVLEDLGLLQPGEGYEGDSERGRYLMRTLSEAFDGFVLQGIFRYQDLGFFDTRERYRLIGREIPRLIFFTDKEELFWLCREISDRFRISAFCSGGTPSLISCEWIARDLTRRQARNLRIAALTDFDPLGREVGLLLGDQLSSNVFGFQTVQTVILTEPGLYSEQTLRVAARPLLARGRGRREVPASRINQWLQQSGGVGGEPLGLPADVVEPELVLARVSRWYEENTRNQS